MRILVATCWVIALAAPATVPADERNTPAATPAASNDRPPAALRELATWVASQNGRLTAMIVDVASGRSIAAHDPDLALNPASNMKIVTAAAVLDALGPHFTFTTGIYGDADRGDVGSLTLRGHGDPSLEETDLWRLARSLAGRGLRRVKTLYVDQSRFDGRFVPPAFDQQPNEWASFRAPVSAIALERNAVTLNIVPTSDRKPATAWFEPEGFVQESGKVATTAVGKGQDVRLTLRGHDGRLEALLSGHIAQGLGRAQFRRRVDDPTLYAGYCLARLLAKEGVVVERVAAGGENEKRRITYTESEPLGVLLRQLGKNSDNFYAEMLLKVLGAEASESPGTSARGARAVLDYLRKVGALEATTRIVNGSGLFDANRLSAQTLTRVLIAAARDPRMSADFTAQLAIGGVDGTLRSRFRAHRQDYAIRAKTGTLRNVVSLSGYVLWEHSRTAFAFVVQDAKAPPYAIRERVDDVVESIARSTASTAH